MTRSQAFCFAAGIAVVLAALVSSLHEKSEELVWAHMIQHELLMVVAAPLLVLGRPLEAWTWALPFRGRVAAGRIARRAWLRTPWRLVTAPLAAWLLHAAALWGWHAPQAFDAAQSNEALHYLQHASFLGSALLFWWAVLDREAPPMAAMALLFTTMLHTGALGALMLLSKSAWYAGHGLEDQQLAGLIMWIPAGLAYPAAALAIASRWLRKDASRWAA